MKNLLRPYLTAFMMGTIVFAASSCDGDEPKPVVEEKEQITTVTLNLVPEGKGQNVTATFRDADGPGGVNATVEALNLAPNTTYTGTVSFYDDSNATSEDITPEIEEEGEEHQVFYEVLNTVTGQNLQDNLSVTERNNDVNGLPLGLQAKFTTAATSSGGLRVTLKHQPGEKNASSGIETGETDVEVTFPVVIQ
ncbi:hypothetical protein ACFS7Z_06290 [Pontibacter toksunensis]|uniref:Type 1 periplasmic binding fold superfamily protein n=1 Tax=Pontibacter toksunensis TaxID=1332631 RepID=A0ABW6BS72_9BACT